MSRESSQIVLLQADVPEVNLRNRLTFDDHYCQSLNVYLLNSTTDIAWSSKSASKMVGRMVRGGWVVRGKLFSSAEPPLLLHISPKCI